MGTDAATRKPLWAQQYKNLDVDGSAAGTEIGTTPKVYSVEIDNTANTTAVYFKIFDAASITVGTTVPRDVIKVPKAVKLIWFVNSGLGDTFTNKMFMSCVTTAGTAGSTNPTSNVKVTVWTDGN